MVRCSYLRGIVVLPLFGSVDPAPKPPHMQWFIPPKKDLVGKTLLLGGKPLCLWTHRVGKRTLPCVKQWPRLAMECRWCDRSIRSTTYVPVMSCDGHYSRWIAEGSVTTWNSVKQLVVPSLVTCHFAKTLKPTLMFFTDKHQLGLAIIDKAARLLHEDRGDITRWLLHYWQWPALTQAFGEIHKDSAKSRDVRNVATYHEMDLLSNTKSA